MAILVLCPSCGSKSKAPDKLAGRQAKCPKCGQCCLRRNDVACGL
jgi:hypothetical protein